MRFKHIMQPAITCLLLLNAPIFGDEVMLDTPDASIEEHVPVGDRETSTREEKQSRRSEQAEEMTMNDALEAQQMLRRVNNKLASTASPFMLAPRQMARPQLCRTPAYPINCHWLTSISDTGRTLEIEDGSHWEIAPIDVYTLRNWRRDDSLVITPDTGWFSTHDYYITNKSNNSYVRANLTVGPLNHGSFSHWIINVDNYGGHVYLENQMIWCVDPQDSFKMRDWQINDHIILGLYNSWFSAYDHILINVAMDDYIRVKQY